MEGRITVGTTIGGRAVNAGDIVDINPDDFQKLRLTNDIEKILPEVAPEPITEEKPKKRK